MPHVLDATVLATAAGGSGSDSLVLLLAIGAALWLLWVWRRPFAPCRWCDGAPRKQGMLRTWDLCRHCNGTGRRVRPLARLFPRNEDLTP